MQSLTSYLTEQAEVSIEAVGRYMAVCIAQSWAAVFDANMADLSRVYDRAGEPAYGTYAQKLLRPLQQQLKEAGFSSVPSFPGTLETSREWGPFTNRQRWMWSVFAQVATLPIGTLVFGLFHDHSQFRLPQAPEIIALQETEQGAILAALSRMRDA